MSKVKVLLLSMVAVFAMGAIVSASASAELVWEECVHTGTGQFTNSACNTVGAGGWEWVPIVNTLNVISKGGPQKLAITSASITITCESVLDTGKIEPGGKDLITSLVYHKCTINISGCPVVKTEGQPNGLISVPAPLLTKLDTLSNGLLVDLVKPNDANPEEEFVTLEIGKEEVEHKAKGACGVLAVKDRVKGLTQAMVNGSTLNFLGEGNLKTDGLTSEYKGEVEQALENGNAFRGK